MLLGVGAALAAAAVFGSASVLQAAAARTAAPAQGLDPRLLLVLLRQPTFVAALLLNLLGFVLHLVALRLVPLFLAQAGIAASLAVTALLAVRVFGDRLGRREWSAVGAVCGGLALLTAAAGATGAERADPTLEATLGAGVAALVVVGAVVGRARGSWTVWGLSGMAGLGFATTAVSGRLLPALTPADLLGAPVTYVLASAGALSFLLYSMALQRGEVTPATSPMIVLQTVTPAVVGVLALGDEVRTGWLPTAALGLVLTVVGAVTLARFEDMR